MSSTTKHLCAGQRRDGHPCRAPALDGAWCWAHSPARAAQRQEAYAKGGRNRASIVRLRQLMPARLCPIFEQVEGAIAAVLDGTLDPKAAVAVGVLARAACALVQAGEGEQRLRDVEHALGLREGTGA